MGIYVQKFPCILRQRVQPLASSEEETDAQVRIRFLFRSDPHLSIFNDTIEGPRAPAVKPGRVTQVLKHSSKGEGCSPVH